MRKRSLASCLRFGIERALKVDTVAKMRKQEKEVCAWACSFNNFIDGFISMHDFVIMGPTST